jgi:uncharacterized protein with GYD domain
MGQRSNYGDRDNRKVHFMAKYLLEVSYTLDGIKGLKSEGGSARVAAATEAIEGLGGNIDAFYFAFGETDVYVVADYPDNVSVAAAALAVSAGGGAKVKTTVLLTPAEIDAAASKKTTYRPPGGSTAGREPPNARGVD